MIVNRRKSKVLTQKFKTQESMIEVSQKNPEIALDIVSCFLKTKM